MRQVPHYLIIGRGRVAKHFQHYFSQLQLSHSSWHRQESLAQLHSELESTTHVLLLINDQAIAPFIAEHLQEVKAMLIHFSGSLVLDGAFGAHPLMTFNDSLYDLSQYKNIPFIIDHNAPAFADVLPGLANPHSRLHTSLKPKYHALCVLSGNVSCLLWQKLFSTLQNEFHIPAEIAHPYLQQQMQNLLLHPDTALTGPLVRRDMATITKNISALEGDAFQTIYKSVVECYQQIVGEEWQHEYI